MLNIKSIDTYNLEIIEDQKLAFAVICAQFESKWIWCKHKKRETWEIPGGKRNPGESILNTAKRELSEETGALEFDLISLFDYSVTTTQNITSFARVFYADVKKIDTKLNSEIGEIKLFIEIPHSHNLTYPQIHPILLEKTILLLSQRLDNLCVSELT